jgi:hypothetical protein
MSALSIFLSSTCYDLKAVREHLHEGIAAFGHEAVRSELPNFPVDPTSQTVAACRAVVREKADILVLIIGGRYGFTDPHTKRSVTNLEYLEARKKGIDRYVFVEAKVWDLLPIYKDNPEANFSSTVDNIRIFDFINEVKNEGSWVYKFNQTSDILTTLRHQLSIRYKQLLTLYRENRITLPREFKDASPQAIDTYTNQAPFWEYTLTHELISHTLREVDEKMTDLRKGLTLRPKRRLSARESFIFVQEAIDNMQHAVEIMAQITTDQISVGWGPPGTPGDAILIKLGCDNLHRAAMSLVDWETNLQFAIPCSEFVHIFSLMSGWTRDLWNQLEKANAEIKSIVDEAPTSGTYKITMTLSAPLNVDEICAELRILSQNFALTQKINREGGI